MAVSINDLRSVTVDFSGSGPAFHAGYCQARGILHESREGYLRISARFPAPGAASSGTVEVPVIMRCSDLYLLGFRSGQTWWRFSDAAWPLEPQASNLGHDGRYEALGGLAGALTLGTIHGVGKLVVPARGEHWEAALRTLLIVVAESLRLVPVQMRVLGLLNHHLATVRLEELEPYIRSWAKASAGADMSRQVAPNVRQGFSDPTIIKR